MASRNSTRDEEYVENYNFKPRRRRRPVIRNGRDVKENTEEVGLRNIVEISDYILLAPDSVY